MFSQIAVLPHDNVIDLLRSTDNVIDKVRWNLAQDYFRLFYKIMKKAP